MGRLLRPLGLVLGWFERTARPLTSRPLVLTIVVGAVATSMAVGGMQSLAWMETASFCGRCHTMAPEVEAHETSSHQTIECAECHVGEGIVGLAKAKLNGTRQMAEILLGSFPKPIPPAADTMPPASETCGRCHDPGRQRGNQLITLSRFAEDEQNTQQQVALVVRLADNHGSKTSGIHWHVLSKVDYVGRDEPPASEGGEPAAEGALRPIDWIGVEKPDGTKEQYIAQGVVEISEQAGLRAAELKSAGRVQRMSCYDCHNRVGHEFPSPTRSIDQALAEHRIDAAIPFIKKRGLAVVTARYATEADAEQAIRELEKQYHEEYPNLLLENPTGFKRSFDTLYQIYRGASHPEMEATAASYPNLMGHTDSAGCFRCHDGGHYKIVDGRLSTDPIPSRCSLCHTFPSVGEAAPNVQLGAPPTSHTQPLWVFNHSKATSSPDPGRTACGACHSQSYCVNCHNSGAKLVKHDAMSFDHAAVIRKSGQDACYYCHQKPFCARCHQEKEAR